MALESGVFGLIDDQIGAVVFVTSSDNMERAIKKYQGDLKKTVGPPHVYRFLCELRSFGYSVSMAVLEPCKKEDFSKTKRKWIQHLQVTGEAFLNRKVN